VTMRPLHRTTVLLVLAASIVPPTPASAAPDALDASFGNGGTVVTDVGHGAFDTAYAVALQQNGKLVVAGTAETSSGERFCVLRYRPNGALDPTFGGDGRVMTSFGGSFQQARDVAIQNGKVVVTGTANVDGRLAFALARYRADGSLDPAFGNGGRVLAHATSDSMDSASALLVLPGGGLVVAGSTLSSTSTPSDFAVARFDPSGAIVPGFGTDGFATVDFSGRDDHGAAVALTPGGNVVVGGASEVDGGSDFALAELDPSGAPVGGFGTSGLVRTAFGGSAAWPSEAIDVISLRSGKLLAVGSVFRGGMVRDHDAALARYRPDGTLDPTFGAGGRVVTDVGSPGGDDTATSVAAQPNGKVVTGGTTSKQVWMYDHQFALTRYRTDGTIDRGFGTNGTATTDFGKGWDLARDLVLTDDGGIVAVGEAGASRGGDIAIARYRAG